jgi:tRNA(Ile)-lysidine synthase TilS/MesJ
LDILCGYATLENLDGSVDINNALEIIRDSIKTSAKENLEYERIKFNKPWFDDECSKLIDQPKQAELQWLHT